MVNIVYYLNKSMAGVASSWMIQAFAEGIRLPEICAQIGSRAFADCPNLVAIYIPANCTNIATDAFVGATSLTIYGREGSYAEFYASKYEFEFVAVDWTTSFVQRKPAINECFACGAPCLGA